MHTVVPILNSSSIVWHRGEDLENRVCFQWQKEGEERKTRNGVGKKLPCKNETRLLGAERHYLQNTVKAACGFRVRNIANVYKQTAEALHEVVLGNNRNYKCSD